MKIDVQEGGGVAVGDDEAVSVPLRGWNTNNEKGKYPSWALWVVVHHLGEEDIGHRGSAHGATYWKEIE